MNQISVFFDTCDPAPSKGYRVYWRVVGSGALAYLGNYFISPVVFTDDSLPGTEYEGIIRSEFHDPNLTCTNVPWSTIEDSGSGGGSGSGSGEIGFPVYARLEITEGAICGAGLEVVYLDPPYIAIQPGVHLYYDQALTMPVLGFMFVADQTGTIFYLDIDDGRVLSPTGNAC